MPKNQPSKLFALSSIVDQRFASVPFIHIQRRDRSFKVQGQLECTLGHRIPRATGPDDGIFVSWRWDGQKLTVENDRYGFYPLFYFADQNQIILSPLIARLLAEGADRTIDDAALAVFLRLGYFLGDDTPFRHIRTVPSGATFEWSSGGLLVHGRRPATAPSTMSRQSALDGFVELFRQSIRRRPPAGRFVLPLSGGRDSRHIFLELCEQDWEPDCCISVDFRNESDAAVAQHLADSQSVPLRIIEPTNPSLEAEIRRNLETSFCSDEHTWSLHLADCLGSSTDCTYDGIAGDVLSSSRFLSVARQGWYEAGDYESIARDLIGHSDASAQSALPTEYRERWRGELALDRITAELKLHAEAPNPMAAFIFWNRTRREIALYSYGNLRNIGRVYAPFLDHDLYDHLASLPAAMLLDRKLHDDAIRQAYPYSDAIPYASRNGQTPVADAVLAELAETALRCLLRAERRSWIKSSYYGLRLVRSRLQKSHRSDALWLASRCLYMLQLEDISANGLLAW